MFTEGPSRFFHKGQSGRFNGFFTDDDLAAYAAKAEHELTPGLRAWLEGGRRHAGDPRAVSAQ